MTIDNIPGIDGQVTFLATGTSSASASASDCSDDDSEVKSGKQSKLCAVERCAFCFDEFLTFGLIDDLERFFGLPTELDGFFLGVFDAADGGGLANTDGFFAIFVGFFGGGGGFFAIAVGFFTDADLFAVPLFAVFCTLFTAIDSRRAFSGLCTMCC